ncbi:HAD family hydrolase [Ktedonobacter robiniae]|uniref:Phosphoglycolate phosphatase n=1 Tax=Ktedonobacter robiniae TaxID=2778365 RepID=A0ABQ3UVC2_9CHLR|nr:HAD family hydrolase [Ktedonobacter robiniae]GHO56537.1 phosphoglycolate phosphatase [Ktedonobacter robiniae]
MLTYDTLLFDLDGTLTDPKPGITKSVQYALARFDIDVPDLEVLVPFIGPPLAESFHHYYGLTPEQAQQAIAYYREYFADTGLYENAVYPGIPALLADLRASHKRLLVATSKPTVFAERILAHFDLAHYFELIVGSELDGTRIAKADVIAYALASLPAPAYQNAIMIGDRKHDIIGAQQNGLPSIAVTYGYGSYEELQDQQPTHLIDSVSNLAILLGHEMKAESASV